MKYCPKCKLRAPADAALCPKCGGAVKTIGGAATEASAAVGAAPAGDLSLQLVGLQHEVRRSRRRMWTFAIVAAALFSLLLALLLGWRIHYVRQFAELREVQVRPVEQSPGEVEIEFQRTSPGKVEFMRSSANLVETLVDHGASESGGDDSQSLFVWSGGERDDYTVTIRYRSGWSLEERRWIAGRGALRANN